MRAGAESQGRRPARRRVLLLGTLALLAAGCATAGARGPGSAGTSSSGRGSGPAVVVTVFNNTRYMADAQILCGGVVQRQTYRLAPAAQWSAEVPPDACGPNIDVQAHYLGQAYTTGPITVGGSGTVNVTINNGRLDYTVGH